MQSGEFGRIIRQARERISPAAVGLAAGGRRRAVGLRREELAGLAGISVDYLTRLEQGRATAPSSQVVESLARALGVNGSERDLLLRLAGHVPSGPDFVTSRVTPSVRRMLDRLADTPAAVYDATWTLLEANSSYDALMGDTSHWRGVERNAVWRAFAGLRSRAVHSDEEQATHESQLVADLRLTAARYPNDRSIAALVRELDGLSPRFAPLWRSGGHAAAGSTSKSKVIEHPAVGRLELDCDVLIVASDDLRMMIYTAEPGSADDERLSLVRVLGTQALVR